MSPGEQRRSSAGPTLIARKQLPAPAGSSRLLAVPVTAQDQRMTVVVGASLRQRDLALADVRNVLLIGGPAALALASLLGYALAALSLRSVELMRRRAAGVSVLEPGQRLPVPPGNDELARLARTLNEMLARNEVAVQRERTFVADASHELRSPLAILRAELDVALLGESPPEELRRAVASAVEEADRLSALAEDLLVLAQADRDGLSIKREAIDVRDSLERLADRFAPVAREAGATIDARAPSGLVVHADRRRLEQALGNLLDNALRHGAARVLVRAEAHGGRLQLQVSDDGPGFPTDFLAHAFERFARPDRSRTAPGAGLGLSIVQAIARAHEGAAYVSNGAGGGAHVCLELPLGTRPPLATTPASAPIGAAA
jgi:signal transduction histidine kinase